MHKKCEGVNINVHKTHSGTSVSFSRTSNTGTSLQDILKSSC